MINPRVQIIQRQFIKNFELTNLFINKHAIIMKKAVIIIDANKVFKREIYN